MVLGHGIIDTVLDNTRREPEQLENNKTRLFGSNELWIDEMSENIPSTPKKSSADSFWQVPSNPVTPRTPGHRVLRQAGPNTKERSAKRRRGRLEIQQHFLGEVDENLASDALLDTPRFQSRVPPSPSFNVSSPSKGRLLDHREIEDTDGNAFELTSSPSANRISLASFQPSSSISEGEVDESQKLQGLEALEEEENEKDSSPLNEDIGHGPGFDEYFDKFSQRKTSSNTLSQLPLVDNQLYLDTIQKTVLENDRFTQTLVHFQSRNFQQWFCEAVFGYNLLFYGFGSKEHFLSTFVEQKFHGFPVFVVKGYFPHLQLKSVLTAFLEFLEVVPSSASVPDMLQQALSVLESGERAFDKAVILVHNIDGEDLVDERFQSALANIAASPNVYFFASVDHVNFPLLWDSSLESLFNFVMHDATTFARYYNETTYENSLGIGRANVSNKEKAIKHVLYSLPANSREIFKLLLIHQLERLADFADSTSIRPSERIGIEYKAFYQKCSSEFLCSNELNFRSQLTEFFDHHIIEMKRDSTNMEIIWIPHPADLLENLLQDMMEDI
ncbi:origin recognition complex subunit Orc2 [Schizosaccharomyces cryophilus OY26]|uniref:Origin recognition complex subunit 2 n=1 Tax=Schizosaccharomyces cryophilus (strain OY26 / ATCC MYA-4695 / CBS 11777 / NBRC 106824 / NRRL Y48691) TaxID=653667 RepID=S9VZ95_SCHCR|nr:origin recognition complex subunit Orc2 [Schizosaccharomyces cryophilus OY26]EPY51130.1 origin recognition complex subunit Orc2 [Schizosaccharomyces cryophilus OY26]